MSTSQTPQKRNIKIHELIRQAYEGRQILAMFASIGGYDVAWIPRADGWDGRKNRKAIIQHLMELEKQGYIKLRDPDNLIFDVVNEQIKCDVIWHDLDHYVVIYK